MVASRVCRRMNTFLSVWKGSLCNDRYRCSGVMQMRAIGGGRIGLGRGGGVYSVDGIRQIQC